MQLSSPRRKQITGTHPSPGSLCSESSVSHSKFTFLPSPPSRPLFSGGNLTRRIPMVCSKEVLVEGRLCPCSPHTGSQDTSRTLLGSTQTRPLLGPVMKAHSPRCCAIAQQLSQLHLQLAHRPCLAVWEPL